MRDWKISGKLHINPLSLDLMTVYKRLLFETRLLNSHHPKPLKNAKVIEVVFITVRFCTVSLKCISLL